MPNTEKGMNLLLQDLREIQLLQRKQTSGGGRSRVGIRREKGFHRRRQGDERALQAHGPIPEPGRDTQQIEKLQVLGTASKQKRLHLSTIHRAKGLEHRAVILLGCVEGVFPLEIRDEVNSPEERRLAYVALTRAKDLFVAISPAKSLRRAHRTVTVHKRNGA